MTATTPGLLALIAVLVLGFALALRDARRTCQRSGIHLFPAQTKRGAVGSEVPDAPIHGGNP
jgi:hypothetical protein